MRCPNCGNEVPDTAKVCGYCGQRLKVTGPVVMSVPPGPPETKAQHVPSAEYERQRANRRFPIWGWIGIGLAVVVGVSALLFRQGFFSGKPVASTKASAQSVYLIPSCNHQVTAHAGMPILFHYGYWGALEEYYQSNYQSMDFQLLVDGKRYRGIRNKEAVSLFSISCMDRSKWDDAWWFDGLFMHDTTQIAPLEPGVYHVEVVYRIKSSIHDGLTDENGDLITYNPGELDRILFTLTVQP